MRLVGTEIWQFGTARQTGKQSRSHSCDGTMVRTSISIPLEMKRRPNSPRSSVWLGSDRGSMEAARIRGARYEKSIGGMLEDH